MTGYPEADSRLAIGQRTHPALQHLETCIGGTNFSTAYAMPYVSGASIAACLCWTGVALYFFRRYTFASWIALATVIILLAYKIAVIGW